MPLHFMEARRVECLGAIQSSVVIGCRSATPTVAVDLRSFFDTEQPSQSKNHQTSRRPRLTTYPSTEDAPSTVLVRAGST